MKRNHLLIAALTACLALPALLGAIALQQHPRPDEIQFLTVVRAFLDFGHDYAKFCDHDEAVAVMAAATMKDLFDKKGMDGAEKILLQLLKETKNQAVRNALHMALKDVYKESGRNTLAAEQLAELIRENG